MRSATSHRSTADLRTVGGPSGRGRARAPYRRLAGLSNMNSWHPSSGRVAPIMSSFTRKSSPALLSLCFLGLAGCAEDNEAAFKEQASKAKGTIPGSRSAQAQTQEEY